MPRTRECLQCGSYFTQTNALSQQEYCCRECESEDVADIAESQLTDVFILQSPAVAEAMKIVSSSGGFSLRLNNNKPDSEENK